MTPRYLDFKDLQSAGIVGNRTQLSRLITKYAFPQGFLLTSNARRWAEEDVAAWVDARRADSDVADEAGRSIR
jgi:predicted DNA-binding transcriptional regulator AlpA